MTAPEEDEVKSTTLAGRWRGKVRVSRVQVQGRDDLVKQITEEVGVVEVATKGDRGRGEGRYCGSGLAEGSAGGLAGASGCVSRGLTRKHNVATLTA